MWRCRKCVSNNTAAGRVVPAPARETLFYKSPSPPQFVARSLSKSKSKMAEKNAEVSLGPCWVALRIRPSRCDTRSCAVGSDGGRSRLALHRISVGVDARCTAFAGGRGASTYNLAVRVEGGSGTLVHTTAPRTRGGGSKVASDPTRAPPRICGFCNEVGNPATHTSERGSNSHTVVITRPRLSLAL